MELESNICLSKATMLLIRDAQMLNQRARQLADLPKHEIHDPVLVTDLLERLRILDAKDNSVPRQTSQYVARAAVLRVNHFLDSGQAKSRELSPEVLGLLKDDYSYMEDEHKKLKFLNEDCLYQQAKLQVAWLKRPFVWYAFKTKSGRIWLDEIAAKKALKLKELQGIQPPGDSLK